MIEPENLNTGGVLCDSYHVFAAAKSNVLPPLLPVLELHVVRNSQDDLLCRLTLAL